MNLGIKSLLGDDSELSKKATIGIIFMILRQFILQSMLLIKILFVASVLGPQIYGTFGVMFVVILIVEQFSQMGLELALIHKHESNYQYNTAWTLKVLRGVILFTIIQIFHNKILKIIGTEANYFMLTAMASILLMEGFVNIGVIELTKELNYRTEFIFRAIPDITNIITTIILILVWHNIWALIMGLISERITRLLLSYILHPYRPNFEINSKIIQELFSYGKWIFLMGILTATRLQGPDVFIAIFLGVIFVAIYQLSIKLATLPTTIMTELIASVSIPTFAKLQENEESTLKTFNITFLAQIYVFTAYFSIFFPYIDLLVANFLGQEWQGMILIIKLLIVINLNSIIIGTIEPLFVAHGIQKRLVKWQLLSVILFSTFAIPIIDHFSLEGLVILHLLISLIIGIAYSYELLTLLKLDKRFLMIELFKIFVLGLSVLFLGFLFKDKFVGNYLFKTIWILAFGTGLFIILSIVFHKMLRLSIITELSHLLNSLFDVKNDELHS